MMQKPPVISTAVIDVQLVQGPVVYDGAELEISEAGRVPAGAGGEAVFIGRTRAETHPELGDLVSLDYEAYESMALGELRRLAEAAAGQVGALAVRVHHTVGCVRVGEASVLVQVLCPHRAEAFAGCRWLIDELKQTAPIWKREVWERGGTWSGGSRR